MTVFLVSSKVHRNSLYRSIFIQATANPSPSHHQAVQSRNRYHLSQSPYTKRSPAPVFIHRRWTVLPQASYYESKGRVTCKRVRSLGHQPRRDLLELGGDRII